MRVFILFTLIIFFSPGLSHAKPLKACLKESTGQVSIRPKCPTRKGFIEINAELLQGLGATQVGPAGAQGPKGDRGATGPQGPIGPQGMPAFLSLEVRSNSVSSSSTSRAVSVTCEEGEVAISGGSDIGGVINGVAIYEGGPAKDGLSVLQGETPNGWRVVWSNPNSNNMNYTVFAVCVVLP